MPNVPNSAFPTIGEVMDLARSTVNDTFPGIGGTQGRILTNTAPFTIPFLNSAFRKLQRRLRNEGVTFPIKDYFIIEGLPPMEIPNTGSFCFVGFNGYFNGTRMFGNLRLPDDCMQVSVVRQRVTSSNLQFVPMMQAMEGLPSAYPQAWLGQWEWRGYAIWFNGSNQTQDIMIRYLTGQPPIQAPPADFNVTPIYILDSQDALGLMVAKQYGEKNGASAEQLNDCQTAIDEAIDEMALEYVRRAQTVSYRREPYQGGGSNQSGNTSLGSTGSVG